MRVALGGINTGGILMSNSAKKLKACTLRDVAGKQIGRVPYFLNKEKKELMAAGKSSDEG